MLEDALPGLEGQVQAIKCRVALFQRIDHPQALQVVLEAPVHLVGQWLIRARGFHRRVERILAGMAEGRVAQIVGQGNRLDQVFVQTQRAGDAAPQLRHLQGMRQTGAEQIAFVVQEDLRLVDEAPERGGVNDPVAVALEH